MIPRALRIAGLVGLAGGLLCSMGCTTPPPRLVATDAVFPPFHYVEADGTIAGYDVEVAREAVSRCGYAPVVVRVASYGALFDGLRAGDHDLVAATTGVTPERTERFGFSHPYFETCQAVAVRSGGDIAHPDDLAGRRVAASAETTSGRAAVALGARVVDLAKGADKGAVLRRGDVDAVIGDEFEIVALAAELDDVRVLGVPAARESYGLVMRIDDVVFRRRIDAALLAMHADGTLSRLRARFGLTRDETWPIDLATPVRRASPPR